ncbi:localization of periplasmic protein complexe [Alkalidesulfovibrio alkalitolerans DSM 16529]|uniref:Localization of periplasmic protein complexe n=1 Tax=Alkalidesulfovibrio alkalitolerans DSM 16529 TaxID=1121439 RepID=S7T7G7_9BACT|nr:localization of periplasmic protein complexe [Alkalidesulfovibrio alkalitolerans DSM 16529]
MVAFLAPLVPGQAQAQEPAANVSPDDYTVRRAVTPPSRAKADLPPEEQIRKTEQAQNATEPPPLILPEPPLPRESMTLPKPAAETARPPSPAAPTAPATTLEGKAEAAKTAPKSTSQAVRPQPDPPSPLATAPAQKPALRRGSVSVNRGIKDGELMVRLVFGGPVDFSTFFLENPKRMILDVPGDWAPKGAREMVVASHGLKSVRLGRHPDKLRVVFDLDPQTAYRSETSKIDDGLVVLFRE